MSSHASHPFGRPHPPHLSSSRRAFPTPLYGETTPHIVIAGGGVAGLTTALALHAAGFERVTVVEAEPAIRPAGAGLTLLPEAVRELDALGLLDPLEAGGVRIRETRSYGRSGRLVSREPLGLGAGHRWPHLAVHRAHLQQVLAAAVRARLGAAALVTGVRVSGVEPLPAGRPRLHLEHRDGPVRGRASLEPDVLVGADGIRSAVRDALDPAGGALHPTGDALGPAGGAPPGHGRVLWRGVSRMPARAVGSFAVVAGEEDRWQAVVYPLSRPTGPDREVLVNWELAGPAEASAESGAEPVEGPVGGPAAAEAGAAGRRGADWHRPVPVETFLPHVEGWEFDGVSVPAVLRAADTAHAHPPAHRAPPAHRTHGRTTLVGDAAHATHPTAGSSPATGAVLDARALAHALAHHDDPAEALAAYERERAPAGPGTAAPGTVDRPSPYDVTPEGLPY